jgi:tetratricopeptide (TPR) repeat protein
MKEEAKKILELAAGQRYEEMLGLEPGASLEEIHRAHIRLLYKVRGEDAAVEAINSAKSAMMAESDLERGRRLYKLGLMAEALPYLKRAAEQRGYAVDFRYVGSALVEVGMPEEARAYFERAVRMKGDVLDEELLKACNELVAKSKRRRLKSRPWMRRLLKADWVSTAVPLAATIAAGCFFTYKNAELGAFLSLILLFVIVLFSIRKSR